MTLPRPIARVTHAALHLSEDGLAALEAPFRGPRAAIAEVAGTATALLLSGVLLVAATAVFAVVYPHFRRIA